MTAFGVDLYFAHPDSVGALATTCTPCWPSTLGVCRSHGADVDFLRFSSCRCSRWKADAQRSARRSRVIAANNILNALFMVVAAAISAILLNKAHRASWPVAGDGIDDARSPYTSTPLVLEFLLRFIDWVLIHTLYRITARPRQHSRVTPCLPYAITPASGPARNHGLRTPAGALRHVLQDLDIPFLNCVPCGEGDSDCGCKEDEGIMQRAFAEVDKELADAISSASSRKAASRTTARFSFRPGSKILESRPVRGAAVYAAWGRIFSRSAPTLGQLRLPRKFWSKIELVAGCGA